MSDHIEATADAPVPGTAGPEPSGGTVQFAGVQAAMAGLDAAHAAAVATAPAQTTEDRLAALEASLARLHDSFNAWLESTARDLHAKLESTLHDPEVTGFLPALESRFAGIEDSVKRAIQARGW